MTPESQPGLTPHEKRVMVLILSLEGAVQGFPDTERKLHNVTRAWAEFMSLEPYHVKFDPQVEPYLTAEEKAHFAWQEGVIPGEWLINKIRKSCEWMPAPVVAREIYCGAGFPPLDGVGMDQIPDIGRRRPIHPVDTEE